MAKPWLKRNPLLSMWLSASNRIVGSIRGQAVAQAKRQMKAAATALTQARIPRRSTGGTGPASNKARHR